MIRKLASKLPFCVLLHNSHSFHFIYFRVAHISNICFYMLDVCIDQHTRNCQMRTHIHTKIHTHTHTQKKVERVGKRKGIRGWKRRGSQGRNKEKRKGQKEKEGKKKRGKREKGRREGGRKEGGKKRKRKKKEGVGWVYGGTRAGVLRISGPHTNNTRST